MSDEPTRANPLTDADLERLNADVERIKRQKAERAERLKNEAAGSVALATTTGEDGRIPDMSGLISDLEKVIPKSTPEQEAAYEWKNHTLPRMAANGVPLRYRYRVTEWNQPPQQRVFEKLVELLTGAGAIVALIGERGAGKTVIAVQTILRTIDEDYRQMFVDFIVGARLRWTPYRKMSDLIARLKPLYADFGTIDQDAIEQSRKTLCHVPLLVIDEIHDCEDQRMRDRILVDLLDRRYSAMVDTVLISNQKPEEFNATTPTSVLSRIAENGIIIPCAWGSWRGRERKEQARTFKS